MKIYLILIISTLTLNTFGSTFYHIVGMIKDDQSSIEMIQELPSALESLGETKIISRHGLCGPSYDSYNTGLMKYSCLVNVSNNSIAEKIDILLRESPLNLKLEKVESIGIKYKFIGFDKNYASNDLEMAILINRIEEISNFNEMFIKTIGPGMTNSSWLYFLDNSKKHFGNYHISKIKKIASSVNICAIRTTLRIEFKTKFSWYQSSAFLSSNWLGWEKCESHLSTLFLNY